MNLTQIRFLNKLARMVLDYPDDEEPVASTQGPLEVVAVKYEPSLDMFIAYCRSYTGASMTKNKGYTKPDLRAITPTD